MEQKQRQNMKLPVGSQRLAAVDWFLLATLTQDQLQRHSNQCSCSQPQGTAVLAVWKKVCKPES